MENEVLREEKRQYLLKNNWYQLFHKDYWLQKGKVYADQEFEGLDTENAYQMQKEIEKSNGKT
jgi:hypothetical protein